MWWQTLPRTMSFLMASVVPHSFLILILISPVVLRWHLVSNRRLWEEDFSILILLSSISSSPSLYHWIFIGSRPTNVSLKDASFPALIITGFINSVRSSRLILGGSMSGKNSVYNYVLTKFTELCFNF